MKTNWELIKTAYVTSDKDMSEIAEAFKVNFDVLRRHAAKEKWTEQRKIFRVTTTKQAVEKRSTEMATDIAQFASDELKLVKAGFALVAEELKSRKPARDIAKALKGFQEVRMRATGEATDDDKDININVKYDEK
jgi:hypothetical protein